MSKREGGAGDSVVVVGGGVIGLSSAWRLAKSGLRVTLLERCECGSGGSGVPVAALWPSAATKRGLGHQTHRASLWKFDPFVREVEQDSGTQIEFARPGRIELFGSEDRRRAAIREVEAAQRDWPSFGEQPVQEILSSEEIHAIEPGVSRYDLGGLLCRASAYVDTRQLVTSLRAACIRRGVILEERREVTDLLFDSGRVQGVLTWEGPVRSASVLVACGAWTSQISEELAGMEIQPVKGQVLVLRPKHRVVRHLLKRRQTYMIPTASGNVVVGATSEPEAGFAIEITDDARESLLRSACEIVPALADAEVVGQWAGLRPQPAGQAAVVGAVTGVPGLYVAAGHFKIGVAMAPMASEQVVAAFANSEAKDPSR